MSDQQRTLIFISHANPEDNVFSRWLALQLAKEGYRVWCDLTRLLGGEDFWADIEDALRSETIKLVYVLSRSSNHKAGPLQELQVGLSEARADGLKDFVFPLRLDDLPHSEINIQLSRLNAIDFRLGWAAGLRVLLEKLEKDQVAKDPRFSPETVSTWWQTHGATEITVNQSSEEYLSNWFSIRQLPYLIYLHARQPTNQPALRSEYLPYPSRRVQHFLVSFASAGDLAAATAEQGKILTTHEIPLAKFLAGIRQPITIGQQEAHNIVVNLLRQGWERYVVSVGMSRYRLSGHALAAFLRNEQIAGNRVQVPRGNGRVSSRQVVGYRARRDNQRQVIGHTFWHFAIQARAELTPFLGFNVIPHILFSDDGRRIWSNSQRLHRARRQAGKNWWNPHWRDRTLGLIQWLAGYQQHLEVPLGSEARIEVEAHPITFTSPVSYADPKAEQVPLSDAEDLEEETDEEADI